MTPELIGILGVGVTLLLAAVALAGLILQQSSSLQADIRALDSRLQALDSRLRTVEQVQAQHGLLLHLLAKQELGLDADLPKDVNEVTETASD